MRKRDLGFLILVALLVFILYQDDQYISFEESWFFLSDHDSIVSESERLPPPVIADLDGDGRRELFVATHDCKIQVLGLPSGRVDEGFIEARLLNEISLLPARIQIPLGRRAVAMAAGTVDNISKDGEITREVLVVVTSAWFVMCFDHNLKKLWENTLQEDFPHGAHHHEVAISISNYTLKHGDAGVVIIGGRMEMQFGYDGNSSNATLDPRQFAIFAFSGRSGSLQWSRKDQFQPSDAFDTTKLNLQQKYKVDAHALNCHQPKEYECRDFRESILGVMPHHWDRREDTSFQLSHFARHKRKTLKKTSGKVMLSAIHKPVENNLAGKDSSSKFAAFIEETVNWIFSRKPRKVRWVPNVVVAHHREGIDVVNLASGHTLCKVHLKEGGLHADIDGDGVLDHVQVAGGNAAEQLKPCLAVITSGAPVEEQLYNVSICHPLFQFCHHGELARIFGRTVVEAGSLEVATPSLVYNKDGPKHRKGSRVDIVFLTNRGEVTSYSTDVHNQIAIRRWQLLTVAIWSSALSMPGMMNSSVVPTLKTFSLSTKVNNEVIIAAGDQEAVVISPSGGLITSFQLPDSPTHSLILEDFSGDGLADVILVTSDGVYGLEQTRHSGVQFIVTTVVLLIVTAAVKLVSHYTNSPNM